MKTEPRPMRLSSGKNRHSAGRRNVNQSDSRQRRQQSADTADANTRLNMREMKRLAGYISTIKQRRGVGWRWFEQFSAGEDGHRAGWYQMVVTGGRVRATHADLAIFEKIHHLIIEDSQLDARLVEATMDYTIKQAAADIARQRIVDLARRNVTTGAPA